MSRLRQIWKIFLASTRLNLEAVCEMSEGLGMADYHDYPDDEDGYPYHMVNLTCKRCGKKFCI